MLWLSSEAWRQLDISAPVDGIAYVGVGNPSLRRRYREEWRPRNSGRSSPRRTLGAVLAHDLRLVPRPRSDRDPKRGAHYYTFGEEGEARLTRWLEEHASFACRATEDLIAEDVETQLIQLVTPPLNLTKWGNPLKQRMREARKAMEVRAAEFQRGLLSEG